MLIVENVQSCNDPLELMDNIINQNINHDY